MKPGERSLFAKIAPMVAHCDGAVAALKMYQADAVRGRAGYQDAVGRPTMTVRRVYSLQFSYRNKSVQSRTDWLEAPKSRGLRPVNKA